MDGPSTPAQPTEEELFEDQNISIRHFDEPEENIHLGPLKLVLLSVIMMK